jgi:hypothetical protein
MARSLEVFWGVPVVNELYMSEYISFVHDDIHSVRLLTFPMHLGPINRPFMPHNMISAQYSPVPLPDFQMAPRLKIIMSFVSKEGTQIHFSLQKSLQANPLLVHQWGPYRERYLLTGHFYISVDVSLFHKTPSLHVPQQQAPTQTPIPQLYLTYLSQSPVKHLSHPVDTLLIVHNCYILLCTLIPLNCSVDSYRLDKRRYTTIVKFS